MSNPQGTPIWYELLSDDADASTAFYEQVIGWTVHRAEPGGMDYRMIDAGGGDLVGGLMNLTDEMKAGGAKPIWLFYIGVDDVDATVDTIVAKGGAIHLPAFDMPGVGRMAMVADPQGIMFYVMRGEGEGDSQAWSRMGMGKCNWNELVTPDQSAANSFYAEVFGWQYPDKMPMGEMGDYIFIEAAGETIGATMPKPPEGQPAGWTFYFRTPDIDAAAERVKAAGGTVHAGPMEVPGGDMVIVASDPQGAGFGIAAPGRPGAAA
jgi:predicted enzyme related to lactoylglutathione lyase